MPAVEVPTNVYLSRRASARGRRPSFLPRPLNRRMPSSDTVLNRITEGFRRVFSSSEDPKVTEAVETLKQVPMLHGMPRRVLRDLAESVHRRDYKRDEFLYYEHDPGLGMYVVQRGRVRLLVEENAGAVHELRQVGEHDVFGKLSLLGDFRRVESAQALADTRVLGFFRPDLRTILKRHPSSGAAFLEAVSRNLAAMETELIRVLVERDGKVEAMRLVDSATARVDHIAADAAFY